jgi:hypothetical protein
LLSGACPLLRQVGREQLVVGRVKSFAGIGARHEIRVRQVLGDPEDLDVASGIIGIGFISCQALERHAGSGGGDPDDGGQFIARLRQQS